jgi:hypothetical protein
MGRERFARALVEDAPARRKLAVVSHFSAGVCRWRSRFEEWRVRGVSRIEEVWK